MATIHCVSWVGLNWGVPLLVFPGLHSAGQLGGPPGPFSPEGLPSGLIHSLVVSGLLASKSGGSKASRRLAQETPNVMSTIFYWSNQVTRPAHSQKMGENMYSTSWSKMQKDIKTGKCNSLGAIIVIIYRYIVTVYHERDRERERCYLCLERVGGREKERDRNINGLPLAHPQLGTWPVTQACALTGNPTGDLSVHRPALNSLSHTSQGHVYFNVWK